MDPWLDDGDVKLYHGEARDVLCELPAESVQTCITSPPYWGLRDYGTAEWEGGDPDCEHALAGGRGSYGNTAGESRYVGTSLQGAPNRAHVQGAPHRGGRATHCRCGALRIDSQIGLEPTPQEYVDNLVDVFRAVRRVLRDDGTLWLNLGDSYSVRWGSMRPEGRGGLAEENERYRMAGPVPEGLKPKDLVGIPWRVAFALQADGWYLRSDIIWSKPSPMPESVTDRPTKSHEYLFLFAKQPRYYYDSYAIREDFADARQGRDGGRAPSERNRGGRVDGFTKPSGIDPSGNGGRNKWTVWDVPEDLWSQFLEWRDQQPPGTKDVWRVATKSFPGAHFATFPPKLIEPCVLAGAPPMCCGTCGAPWRRVIERTGAENDRDRVDVGDWIRDKGGNADGKRSLSGATYENVERPTERFEPTCEHHDGSGRPLVLDPFSGAGTTALVARDHQRHAVGIDLNEDYLELAAGRLQQLSLLAV